MLAIFLLAAAAQSAGPPPERRHGGRPFISPMGEPFRPETREGSGLSLWFAQADSNHDGQLTLAEMQADAERFFGTLDVNHDGEVDPDEVTRYETVVAPEISGMGRFDFASSDDAPQEAGETSASRLHREGRRHKGGGFFSGGDDDNHQGAARFGLLDLPEPVVSADFNFNRGISLSEFRQAAQQRFIALDLDHRGRLTLEELAKIRPAPAARPTRNVIPGQAPTDDGDTTHVSPPQ